MDLGLRGKVALVTGGARDIGRAVAVALAREGAAIVVNYLHSKREAESTVADIERLGSRAIAYQADVADRVAVETMVAEAMAALGRIDILVNNAGYIEPRPFLETAPDTWKRQIDVGLYGVMNTCHVVGPLLVKQGSGRIVNLVGDSARVGQPRLAVTAASRGGVLSLTKTLARELGRANVTVNAVAMGWVETSHVDPKWLETNRERILALYPIRHLGRPDDIAPLVAFLASDLAGWITGQTISVSGGYTTV